MSGTAGPLQDKIAVITGGGSGMGAATVRRFVEAGATVVAVDVNGSEKAIAEEVGDRVIPVRADVAKTDDLRALFALIDGSFGKIDVLFNNAGTAGPDDQRHIGVDQMSLEQMELMWTVNLRAVIAATGLAVPFLKKAGGGSVISTASVAAYSAHPFQTAYAASKAGVVGFTKSAAAELGVHGIRVNAILPGPIDTPLLVDHITPEHLQWLAEWSVLKRRGTPDEIAKVALFLASDASSYVTGVAIPVDGGSTLGASRSAPASPETAAAGH
jgi:NAD(P)-dependent dehydrogenase (short-subunit alcohol dehydrogenase family)